MKKICLDVELESIHPTIEIEKTLHYLFLIWHHSVSFSSCSSGSFPATHSDKTKQSVDLKFCSDDNLAIFLNEINYILTYKTFAFMIKIEENSHLSYGSILAIQFGRVGVVCCVAAGEPKKNISSDHSLQRLTLC